MARTRLYPPSVDPGFPVLPPKPEGWLRTTFEKIVEPVERPVKLEPAQTYRLVNAKRSRGGIVLRSELTGREILTKTQFETKAGDFLISRRQIIHGACGVVPPELDGAVVSNEYSSLQPRPSLLLSFLQHYSHTPYFQRTCFHSSHGVDVEKMIFKLNEWLAREVDVPPLGEQRKIAAILSSVDDAIEATQAVIDQLQVVKKAMMAELLTRGLPGRHTRFKQTEIGEVPEGWTVRTISDVSSSQRFSCTGGPFGSDLTSKHYQDIGTPVIRGSNLNSSNGDRWLLEAEFAFVSEAKADELHRNLAHPGDVVFTQRGTLGQVARIRPDSHWDRFVISQSQMKLTVDPSIVNADFVTLYFLSPAGQKTILRESIATGVPHINLGILKSLTLPTPPLNEQQEIVTALDAVGDRVSATLAHVATLHTLKSALASVLLTGEVRVTPDEAAP
jgi:type I restriction enzyme, S subunit